MAEKCYHFCRGEEFLIIIFFLSVTGLQCRVPEVLRGRKCHQQSPSINGNKTRIWVIKPNLFSFLCTWSSFTCSQPGGPQQPAPTQHFRRESRCEMAAASSAQHQGRAPPAAQDGGGGARRSGPWAPASRRRGPQKASRSQPERTGSCVLLSPSS